MSDRENRQSEPSPEVPAKGVVDRTGTKAGEIAQASSSQVEEASDSSQAEEASDSSQVEEASDSSQAEEASDSSQAEEASDSSQAEEASDSSQVEEVSDSSQAEEASDSSQVEEVSDKAEEDGGDEAEAPASEAKKVKLNGLYLFKKGMSSVYNDKGEVISVTVLEYKPSVVSQVKTEERDGYQAVQLACMPRRTASAAELGHLKPSGMENGARVIKEIRQALPEGVCVGQRVEIESLAKGDKVNVMGHSKGRGFAGGMKRWGFAGGPASHGSGFHRRPGSIGNCADPGRVMPGRKMPGHLGVERVTIPRTSVVEVIAEENVVLVKGPVPGAANSLVQVVKV